MLMTSGIFLGNLISYPRASEQGVVHVHWNSELEVTIFVTRDFFKLMVLVLMTLCISSLSELFAILATPTTNFNYLWASSQLKPLPGHLADFKYQDFSFHSVSSFSRHH